MNIENDWSQSIDELGKELTGRPSLRSRILERIEERRRHVVPQPRRGIRPRNRKVLVWTTATIVVGVLVCSVVVACFVGFGSAHPNFGVIDRTLPAGDLMVSLQLTPRHHTGDQVIPEESITMRVDPRTGGREPIDIVMAYGIRQSPDGRYVAVNAADETLRILRASGEEVCHVDTGGTPVWAPDSQSVLCTRRSDGEYATVEYDVESCSARPVALPGTDSVHDWSLDGAWLAVVSSRHEAEGRMFQIYLRTVDGRVEKHVPTGNATYALRPRFSADGSRLAFVVVENQVSRLGVFDLRKEQVRLLPGEWDGTLHACWSPDGSALAVKTSQAVGIVDVATGRYDELEIDLPWRAGRLSRLAGGDFSAMRSSAPLFIGALEWLQP